MTELLANITGVSSNASSLQDILLFVILLVAVLIFAYFAWSVIRVKMQNKKQPPVLNAALEIGKARKIWQLVKENTNSALKAIRYLTTYREWRYKTSWYLLCGDEHSGKTSLVSSVTSGQRQNLLLKEKKLVTEGTGWRFFNKGVVIDVAGRYFSAAEESRDGKWWHSIIEMIQRYRPERPLDGIILTVSAEKLLQANNQAALNNLGEHIYTQLWEIQKQYAFVLPVYIIVTKCDLVRGFAEFWKPFDKRRFNEILGWSNDSSLDNAFSTAWIDKAFASIEQNLHKAQLGIAAGRSTLENPDEFFLFPTYFKQLKKPLTLLLAKIFEKSAFHESFFFRGVYFTGLLPFADELDRDKVRHSIVFSNHLFDLKIFAETYLARAVQQSLISRNRLIRRVQLASIALLIGLWIWFVLDKISLNHQVQTVSAVLRSVQGATLECSEDTHAVNELLLHIAEMDAGSLVRPGIPVSWLSPVDADLSQYLADTVFGRVIFPNMECLFHRKLYELIYTKVDIPEGKRDKINKLNHIKDALEQRVTGIADYERMHELFRELSVEKAEDSQVLEKFSSLADYLFDRPLPSEFYQKKDLYEKALLKVEYKLGGDLVKKKSPLNRKHLDKYRLLLTARIEKISLQLLAAIKDAAVMPERLAKRISALQNNDIETGLSDKPISFSNDIHHFSQWLASLEESWLHVSGAQNLCGKTQAQLIEFNKIVKEYHYPGTRLSRAIQLFNDESCHLPFIEDLIANRLPGVGQLFYEKPNHILEVKRHANHVISNTGILNTLSYLHVKTDSEGGSSGAPVKYWDISKLNAALAYYAEYENFLEKYQPPSEQGNQADIQEIKHTPIYKLIANAKLQQVVLSLLNQAQLDYIPVNLNSSLSRPLSAKEERIALQIQNFRAASDLLQQLMTIFSQLNWQDGHIYLSTINRLYVTNMLEQISILVDESHLYAVNPTPRWGVGNFAEALYELSDDIQIKDYLESQKGRIEYIAFNYAEPLVNFFLNTQDAGSQNSISIVNKWKNTLSEIGRYQRKDPAGRVNQLDQFFLTELNQLTQLNCKESLSSAHELDRGHDFFSMTYKNIRQSVAGHCKSFNYNNVLDQYQLLAEAFNERLAGRYPFSYPLDAGRYEAGIDATKTFFDQYRSVYEGLAEQLMLMEKANLNQDVIQFVRELEQCARFFNALFFRNDAAEFIQQPVNISVDFRAYPEQAYGSNQIISWMLSNGRDTLYYPDGTGAFNWSPGRPLSLTLRWASGSSYKPTTLAGAWQPAVEDVNATFASGGDWALIHFLQAYRASSLSKPEILDGQTYLLEFNTPMVARSKSDLGTDSELLEKQISKTYLRLRLQVLDPKTKQPMLLRLPALFPAFAPEFKG